MSRRQWFPGDPVPGFAVRASNNAKFHFDTAAGRYLVLCFYGSAGLEKSRAVLAHMTGRADFFDDERAAFFGVSIDPGDEAEARVAQVIPGFRYFWDFEREVSRLYGALLEEPDADNVAKYSPFTLVIDPALRVLAHIPLIEAEQHNKAFDEAIAALPPLAQHAGTALHAPVLILPRVFEPDFCARLIALFEEKGGSESGFMREVGGKTVGILDDNFKRRKDFAFDEQPEFEPLRAAIRERINRRLVPEIAKAFQFRATRMERYVVARYDSRSRGFFRPHRDNTTRGTAHRCFACTVNLNAEDYDGGELRFPEFGQQTYRAPTGGAVVFSCSLLHEATAVTRGNRYAFLPFFYDEPAARLRQHNSHALTGKIIDRNKGEDELAIAD